MPTGEKLSFTEVSLSDFAGQVTAEAVKQATERLAGLSYDLAPVLDPARTKPPGEGWSLPPGHMKGSISVDAGGTDAFGRPYADMRINPVQRFRKKKRHAIRDFVGEALAALWGEPL